MNNPFSTKQTETTLVVLPNDHAGSGFNYTSLSKQRNEILALIERNQFKLLVVDFSNLGENEIIGSVQITSLIALARKVAIGGGRACFCAASPEMLEVLVTMNLTKLWPHYENREAAIAALPEAAK